jgi:hypothetical protein
MMSMFNLHQFYTLGYVYIRMYIYIYTFIYIRIFMYIYINLCTSFQFYVVLYRAKIHPWAICGDLDEEILLEIYNTIAIVIHTSYLSQQPGMLEY